MLYPIKESRKDRISVKQTHTHNFSPEEISQLSSNKYVKTVSPSTVRFTEEFKQHFVDRRSEGATSPQIFRECGIDPAILGESRIEGFRFMVKKQAAREGGLIDLGIQGRRLKASGSRPANETDAQKLSRLEHELAYTRQEVEFLKKLQMADMEARRQWESKHRPK